VNQKHPTRLLITTLTDFKSSFTVVFRNNIATKPLPEFPPHLKCVATLPCEIWVFKLCRFDCYWWWYWHVQVGVNRPDIRWFCSEHQWHIVPQRISDLEPICFRCVRYLLSSLCSSSTNHQNIKRAKQLSIHINFVRYMTTTIQIWVAREHSSESTRRKCIGAGTV